MSETKVELHPTQQITVATDSREILANARKDTAKFGLDDYFIVDVDSHHVELDSWPEIIENIEDPVLRDVGRRHLADWPQGETALSAFTPGLTFQDVGGRIPHQAQLAEYVPPGDNHRDVTLIQRAMDSMSIDVQVVFPQPMLEIGLHPSPEIGLQLMNAYNKWFTSTVLGKDPRIKTMLGLPFENPAASLETIRRYHDHPDVIGFLVTSQRHVGVHNNAYIPVYAELERLGMPIGFHAGPSWGDTMTKTMNRFLSVHAMSFVTCNMTHLTNWIINGIPERFPDLKVIWIESGLAWLPFMMQRLDHEYVLRTSDAPMLTKLPSEYMREMYYTSQPLEITDDALLKSTFDAIDAENTLMYSSDWPHWDFDVPGRIMHIPFLSDQGKRNILGETSRKVFNL
ncbi:MULTISPECIES: amidohydrolase family protein [Brevibacterium]|uniref:Amidohydrolase family protein n=2 Tax=Brevibacterium TaxID=1696 RepID=A0ABP9U1X0_9MICO|nr:amidohydrolase family protein [Brevibacterium sp. 2SA]